HPTQCGTHVTQKLFPLHHFSFHAARLHRSCQGNEDGFPLFKRLSRYVGLALQRMPFEDRKTIASYQP
ncbi:MAG: hypothetical protein WCF11_08325, partial [Azonexus sp.]